MPYAGIPSDKTGKMDSCVRRVTGTGKSKDTAVAICHDAVMGKKKGISESEWETMSEKEVEQVVDEVLEEGDNQRKEATSKKGWVPYGVTSFEALDSYRIAQKQADMVYSATSDFNGLVESIMFDSTITDKVKAVKSLADEYAKRVDAPIKSKETSEEESGFLQRIVKAVGDAFGIKPKEVEPNERDTAMMIWKEDDGSYGWAARYSNNFRDNDNPPEIISEKSHRAFVDKVDAGEYDLPELWLWHRPEWKCGVAKSVAYDDSGFAVATGTFDKGKELVAEWLSKQKDVAVSHAMPKLSIVRDTEDSSIIVQHQTVEISPLPLWAAANKLTGFIVVQDASKEADMAIPQKKRDSLVKDWGIDPTLLDNLEAQNAADAAKAASDGRESKEANSDAPVADSAGHSEQESEPTPVADPAKETATQADPLNQPPSRREIADAFGVLLTEMKEDLEKIITERIGAIEETVKELKKSDEEKVKETASNIPTASLAALISQRVVGSRDAVVDGRSSLAQSKPKETETVGSTGIPFIDRMVSGK